MLKRLLQAFTVSFLFIANIHAAVLEPTTVRDFTCGKVDTQDPTLIGDGCAQELWNVDVWTGRIQKRRGSILQNSTDLGSFSNQPVKFLHEFPDQSGNFWMLSYSSNTLFKSNDGGASNTILSSTFGMTSQSVWDAVNAFGRAYLTDGTTNWIVYDGNVLISSTAPPKGKLVAFMFGRLWTADVTGARSTLYYSRINDPNDWTDSDLDDGEAGSEFVRQNDGYYIRALIPFKNSLLIFKDYSIDSLTMASDGLTPIITPISNNVGTQHRRSVVQTDNAVIFVGADAVYEYTGPALRVISDGIEETFESILQRNSTSRSALVNSQSDFQNGVFKDVNAAYTSGSVVLSTWTGSDTSSADFGLGTLTNVDTTTVSGQAQLSTNNESLSNAGFEDGPLPDVFSGWSVSGTALRVGSEGGFDPQEGTWQIRMTFSGVNALETALVQLLDLNGDAMDSDEFITNESWAQKTFDVDPVFKGRIGRLKITGYDAYDGSTVGYILSEPFIVSGEDITFYARANQDSALLYIDNTNGGRSTIYSGSFISRTYDTGFSSAAWLATTFNVTENGNTVAVRTQSSADGSAWGSSETWTSGQAPASAWNKYIRYQVNFSTTSSSVGLPSISEANLKARSTTGVYISSPLIIGTAITSWGAFSADGLPDGGSLTYALYTDTNTVISTNTVNTWVSSQTITSGQVPTVATAPYVFLTSKFAITVATSNPQVNSLQLEWNEGSSNFPIWATFFEHEYHCAVATTSVSNNDTVLVFDQNRAWTEYIGFNPYVLTKYRQGVYYGDATRGRIYRYNVSDVYTDNGAAIHAKWRSKEFDFGYPFSTKTMTKYQVTARYTLNSDISFGYGVNRGGQTSVTLDLDSVSGFFRKSIVPNSDTYKRGVTHSFTLTDSDTDDPFDFLSITLYPSLETDPQ